jgi:hypothetical protein
MAFENWKVILGGFSIRISQEKERANEKKKQEDKSLEADEFFIYTYSANTKPPLPMDVARPKSNVG